jgi:hypothetical protein
MMTQISFKAFNNHRCCFHRHWKVGRCHHITSKLGGWLNFVFFYYQMVRNECSNILSKNITTTYKWKDTHIFLYIYYCYSPRSFVIENCRLAVGLNYPDSKFNALRIQLNGPVTLPIRVPGFITVLSCRVTNHVNRHQSNAYDFMKDRTDQDIFCNELQKCFSAISGITFFRDQ